MFVFSQDLCSLFKTKLTYFVKKIWISSFNIIFLTKCELDLLYKYTVSWIFIFTFDLVYWSCKLNIFLYWKLTSCAWNNKMIGAYYLLLFYTKWYNFIPNGSHWQGSRSDQISRSVVSNSLRPHELQHARPPCPSPTPGVHSDSSPSSQWCHPAISSSVVPFSSFPQSLPASESFPMSQLFAWGGQSTGVSALASFLPKKCQGWSEDDTKILNLCSISYYR